MFDGLSEEALSGYDKVIGLDLSDVAVDGSLQKSPCGGEGTGKNPTDRAKLGWKWSILTDRNGIPLGWAADGANRNDSVMLEPTLDDASERGLLSDIETIWLDRGYDSEVTRQRLADRFLHQIRHVTRPRHLRAQGARQWRPRPGEFVELIQHHRRQDALRKRRPALPSGIRIASKEMNDEWIAKCRGILTGQAN